MGKIFHPPKSHILLWLEAFTLPSDTILDVGSGEGRHCNVGESTYYCLDSWPAAEPDYLLDLNEHDLPMDRDFSLILLLDLLEHLKHDRGREILQQAQDIAKKAVVVFTPLLFSDNRKPYEDEGFYQGNSNVLHLSLWNLSDFDNGWTRVWRPDTQKSFFGYWVK